MQPFEDVSDEPLLNIKAVAQTTGIDSVTLRAWERRYGVPSPGRTDSGYRLYSDRDIAILTWLKAKVDAGVAIGRAVAMLHSHTPQQSEHILPRSQGQSQPGSFAEIVPRLLQCAHSFDAVRAQQIITQTFALYSVEETCVYVLLPALQQIGLQWRNGEASLQVEHFLTNVIRQQLLAIGATLPPPSRSGRVIAGCAPGDWHEMPVLMLSIFLQRLGWEVIYLGQAIGLDQLSSTLEALAPRIVILSASTFHTLQALVEAGDLAQRAGVAFAFGGSVFTQIAGLSERVPGAYLGGNLISASRAIDGYLGDGQELAMSLGYHPPELHLKVVESLRRSHFDFTSDLAQQLRGRKPDVHPDAVVDDARQMGAAVITALAFGLPAVLQDPSSPLYDVLNGYDFEWIELMAAFTRHLPADEVAVIEAIARGG